MGEVLSALGIVLGTIVLLRAGYGLIFERRAQTRGLRVVESCALGSRQRLHVVEVEGERLLVAAAEGRVSLLRRLPRRPSTEPVEAQEAEPAPSRRFKGWLRSVGLVRPLFLLLCLLAAPATAAPDLPSLSLEDVTSPERLSNTLEIIALMTVVSVAPSILLMATCFTRIVIVLSLLRQAIGINQLPPNQVLIGLGLLLTLFVMAPVGKSIHEQSLAPYMAREIDGPTAVERAIIPARAFLMRHTREKDLALFVSIAKVEPASPDDTPLSVLLPSFMISELRTAFEIGFMVFLPFLIIDLVVASVLISMGMIVLPPIVISLPFKLMLFVLLDGWNLVIGSLVRGLA